MAIPRKSRTSTSPAPTTGNSTTSQSGSKGVPNWIIPLGIAYLVIRGLTIIAKIYIGFWDWILILGLAVVAIINLLSGKQKSISLITIIAIGCILWGNDHNIKSNTSEQSAGQEQVASPSPPPEVWDSTQFSDRGGILLNKPSQEVNVTENSELCVSELINPLTNGNLQQKIFVGEEFFSSRMSQCWGIAKGKYTIRIGDKDSAEIKQYIDYSGRVPVIRPK
jgi:hypothetical protein